MKLRLACAVFAVFASGCSDGDGDGEPAWTQVFDGDDLDRVVRSVWGSGPDAVYLVGGGLGGSRGPLLAHYDGSTWKEIASDAADAFWWVWGTYGAGDQGDVFAVGEQGAIYRIRNGSAEAMTSPTNLTLFGVWGESPSDLWAVGGDALAQPPTAVILRYDGANWTDETPDSSAVPIGGALNKVWGSSPNDVFAVGQNGTVLHYDGANWAVQQSGVEADKIILTTVFGASANDVYAVGGAPARVLHYDGSAWSIVNTGIPASVLNGVSVAPDGEVLVVGNGGVKMRLRDGQWSDETEQPPFADLHAVWLDTSGVAYTVGGNFLAPRGSQRLGAVGYYGTEPPPTSLPSR